MQYIKDSTSTLVFTTITFILDLYIYYDKTTTQTQKEDDANYEVTLRDMRLKARNHDDDWQELLDDTYFTDAQGDLYDLIEPQMTIQDRRKAAIIAIRKAEAETQDTETTAIPQNNNGHFTDTHSEVSAIVLEDKENDTTHQTLLEQRERELEQLNPYHNYQQKKQKLLEKHKKLIVMEKLHATNRTNKERRTITRHNKVRLRQAWYLRLKAEFGLLKDTTANRTIMRNHLKELVKKRKEDYRDIRDIDFAINSDWAIQMALIPNEYELEAKLIGESNEALKRHFESGKRGTWETITFKLNPSLWSHWYSRSAGDQ
jgi:hypothetical protein